MSHSPVEIEVRIVNQLGMHARPAAEFVKVASRFEAKISVAKDGLSVDGKSIMGMLMLAAERGSTLVISTSGQDAPAAAEALRALVADGFGEAGADS